MPVLRRISICQRNCLEDKGSGCNHSKLGTDGKQTRELPINSHAGSFTNMRPLALLLVNYCYALPCAILLLGFL